MSVPLNLQCWNLQVIYMPITSDCSIIFNTNIKTMITSHRLELFNITCYRANDVLACICIRHVDLSELIIRKNQQFIKLWIFFNSNKFTRASESWIDSWSNHGTFQFIRRRSEHELYQNTIAGFWCHWEYLTFNIIIRV